MPACVNAVWVLLLCVLFVLEPRVQSVCANDVPASSGSMRAEDSPTDLLLMGYFDAEVQTDPSVA